MREEITDCSGAECVAIADIGNDWFRMRSTAHTAGAIAVTGEELRAFLRQVRAGQFDELARLAPDATVAELTAENADLRGELDELRRLLGAVQFGVVA